MKGKTIYVLEYVETVETNIESSVGLYANRDDALARMREAVDGVKEEYKYNLDDAYMEYKETRFYLHIEGYPADVSIEISVTEQQVW